MKTNEKTKKALTGLEWAINQMIEEPKKPDEFTAEEFAIAANIRIATARNKLDHSFNSGILTKRKILVNGRMLNLFSKAE